MIRPAAAALSALLTLGAGAASAATRVSGKVLAAEISSDPSEGSAGSLVIVDKAGQTASYWVLGTTRVTRDGKKMKFDTTLIGDLVVRAKFDPKTKTLTVLDLKSSGTVKPAKKAAPAAKAAAPATVTGEVAFADDIKGALSVRMGKGATRDFAVVETTKVLREKSEGAAQVIGFENVSVGETVEVSSLDGKTAAQIRVRAAAR